MKTIDHLEKTIELVKKHGLCNKLFNVSKVHLEAIAKLLNTTPVQTAIFSVFLEQFGEYSVSVGSLAETLKCNKIQLIRYMDDIEELRKKRLIRQTSSFSSYSKDNQVEYTVPMDVINSLRKNEVFVPKNIDNLTPAEFFDCAEDIISKFIDDELDRNNMNIELNDLYEHNKNVCFVKKIKDYKLEESSMLIMINLCTSLICRSKEKYEIDELSGVLGSHDFRQFRRELKAEEHILFKEGLVEFDFYKGMADTENCILTKKAQEEFLADVEIKAPQKSKGKSFISAEKITEKKLYYNHENTARIQELTSLLQEENFKNIQSRLSENGMRTGFACMFSGPPGTGKTETVYQVARTTGRDIMMVNIEETKSMWFGQSERLIKGVFDEYRTLVKKNGLSPILLFNEADAILGKRREISDSSGGCDQTENAIQNIILQEIEDLNGILIATTNMTKNLDKAFERRFLYKIEFEKPDAEAKKAIWKTMLPSLSDQDALCLAEQFDFSGGQIENIARKSLVSLILKGSSPQLEDLQKFCKEEVVEKKMARIGFGV